MSPDDQGSYNRNRKGKDKMKKRAIIAITMGDPAGSGPEITVKALSDPAIYDKCRPLVVGDASIIRQASIFTDHPSFIINEINDPEEGTYTYGTIDVLHLGLIKDLESFRIGEVSKEAGNAAFASVVKAIELAKEKKVAAIVTNALNKEALNLALADKGLHFDGHTEILATYTNCRKYAMMLALDDFRVVHVSTHVSLKQACERVRKERVREVIELGYRACLDLGIESPRVGVCGLNPHAGENGLFGDEEIKEIIPAIEEAKKAGINAIGPLPPDSAFSALHGGLYDILVCMYHDQGHIPVKTLGFNYDRKHQEWQAVKGVNITLGLPIIRTSVDHGTDFVHAGKGTSNEASLVNALEYAIALSADK
jgi:4-hydroxythreonine-4-phosphate dehydrogenase